jgi:hypothetical protein
VPSNFAKNGSAQMDLLVPSPGYGSRRKEIENKKNLDVKAS